MRNISTKDMAHFFWPAVLCGLLASSRINFLVILPVISLYIFMYSKKAGVTFGALATLVAILPSVYLYFLDPQAFTPFHLIEKGNYLLKTNLKIAAIVMSVITFLVSIYLIKISFTKLPFALFISLAPSLIILAVGDLKMRVDRGEELQYVLSTLDGFNYFTPLLPLAVFILTTRVLKSN